MSFRITLTFQTVHEPRCPCCLRTVSHRSLAIHDGVIICGSCEHIFSSDRLREICHCIKYHTHGRDLHTFHSLVIYTPAIVPKTALHLQDHECAEYPISAQGKSSS